ncbi:MAG: glucosamine-6-phosphate deaminase [Spirochaetaceae bacterium]|nr:MAG: glucosamine-6-phosphate deaminase [Spirochaetaceae bacterium]
MEIHVSDSQAALAAAAAEKAAAVLKQALSAAERVRVIAATGNSQLQFLEDLCSRSDIEWNRTEIFHLDEYVGIPKTHPASFSGYIQSRIVDRIHPAAAHLINGEAADAEAERQRISSLIQSAEVDVAFLGIGENGHLAFNDPPADFQTDEPYIIAELDRRCRLQQVGEGWFASLGDVPSRAYTMSIRQILKSRTIVCVVPDERKAEAVRDCLDPQGAVSPAYPASVLKTHADAHVFLDRSSASLLSGGGQRRSAASVP